MERLSRPVSGGYFIEEHVIQRSGEGYTGEAVERLARFENMLERLLKERDETAAELERLRNEGKEKSVTFKQLLAKKLMNSNMLVMFEASGIKTE